MMLKITNLHILRYLPTYWLYLLERYTIDNQRCTYTASKLKKTLPNDINQDDIFDYIKKHDLIEKVDLIEYDKIRQNLLL